jgi:hypothetical protein
VNLPIELVPGSRPPRFRWTATISMVGQVHTLRQEGSLPSGVDVAVASLIGLCGDLDAVNGQLRIERDKLVEELAESRRLCEGLARQVAESKSVNEGLVDRVAAQSELLAKKGERGPTTQPVIQPLRKGNK